ncbi:MULTISPECIES: hypothetical protein [unclassified Psychrobacter]|uniref:hypothetical protein n=1 Tax=unclassified Psychrobacter TaxID=196806 RepID=UPI000C31E037|nr:MULTISPECIES: hypothetical protein [unclassified Psychrobacter]MBA6244507.1 hypothetical protein [Psychrobacter sp. Urea-trap-18]MBA6285556.1 hypothetical protein [Psychrobacter sp. Urea-trap-16]MBA6317755.1 hypothetical protein [Psychrobacter sp. Urea-trap-20]MBA6334510.1 hypothetical protein [Psychrobacter sp. Urea-trap-19]MDN3448489.1 hypothetical protein [Psychrobacter sp. APC 3281]|tara:strand:+ start:2363 stop:2656 length:294 start_codon:yes stop_codon:yes gene_type:complete
MKIINYEELFGEFKPDGAISVDANLIANALMRELYVPSGHNLARFLGVKRCFNNDMAMRVWVQKRLDAQDGYFIKDMSSQLQSELYELLPHSDYGSY